MFSGGMVGRRSLQDRARPSVSRVGMPRSRSRFSTVVGSTPRYSPTRASAQPELYRRITSSTWLGERPRWRMSTPCLRRIALTVRTHDGWGLAGGAQGGGGGVSDGLGGGGRVGYQVNG